MTHKPSSVAFTRLYHAINVDSLDKVRMVCEDCNLKSAPLIQAERSSILEQVVRNGNINMIKYLFDILHFDPEKESKISCELLCCAVCDVNLLRFLLAAGAAVDLPMDKHPVLLSKTPLSVACSIGVNA